MPSSEAQSWELAAAKDVREYLKKTVRISKDCEKDDGCGCLHPALADKIVVGELEWLKRGRFERIFPISGSEPELLGGKVNACSVHWHAQLRRRGARAEEDDEEQQEERDEL